MADNHCDALDADSLEKLFEPTVEVPAALFLVASCCPGCRGTARAAWPAWDCC